MVPPETCYAFPQNKHELINDCHLESSWFGDLAKRHTVYNFINSTPCDFWLLQGTLVSSQTKIDLISKEWPGSRFWSPAIGKEGGVAVLVSPHFRVQILQWRRDAEGRVLSILLEVNRVRVNVVNIYAPTNKTKRTSFLRNYLTFSSPTPN